MIDPLYVASGFGVGLLVGMTGVGGGSLMTPLLILLFGIHPSTAVGTDLLYAAATKTGGSLVHGVARSIHWPIVGRLACGSIPASVLTLAVLGWLNLDSGIARSLINLVLCFMLFLTAAALIWRNVIMKRYRHRFDRMHPAARRSSLFWSVSVSGCSFRFRRWGPGPSAWWRCCSSIRGCRWRESSVRISPMRCR